jgi:hypothetical protein
MLAAPVGVDRGNLVFRGNNPWLHIRKDYYRERAMFHDNASDYHTASRGRPTSPNGSSRLAPTLADEVTCDHSCTDKEVHTGANCRELW